MGEGMRGAGSMPIKLPFSYSTVHSQADFRKDPSRRRWCNAAEPAPGRVGRRAIGVDFIYGLCYFVKCYRAFFTITTSSESDAKCRPNVSLLPPSGPAIASLLAEPAIGC